jgi:hypothetical protein
LFIALFEYAILFVSWETVGMIVASFIIANWHAKEFAHRFKLDVGAKWLWKHDMTLAFIIASFWPIALLVGLVVKDERVERFK